MAIVKMKHLRLAAMQSDREALLRLLQGMGCLEIEEPSVDWSDPAWAGLKSPDSGALSAARAAATVRYLTERGITPTRLRAVAYADTRPVEPGTSEASLRRNRRVEFYFHRPEAGTASMEY